MNTYNEYCIVDRGTQSAAVIAPCAITLQHYAPFYLNGITQYHSSLNDVTCPQDTFRRPPHPIPRSFQISSF